jgi:hypothetical protein
METELTRRRIGGVVDLMAKPYDEKIGCHFIKRCEDKCFVQENQGKK